MGGWSKSVKLKEKPVVQSLKIGHPVAIMATQYMRDMLLFLVLAVKSDPFHILQSYTLLEDIIESYGHKEKRSISQSTYCLVWGCM